jgi:hypothetical protein
MASKYTARYCLLGRLVTNGRPAKDKRKTPSNKVGADRRDRYQLHLQQASVDRFV